MVDIHLVDERGETITAVRDVHALVGRALAEASEGSNILRFVDPYGDTTLNGLQIPSFLEDWERVKSLVVSDLDRQAWSEVMDLAQRCQTETHVYLRFVGD